MFRHRMIVATLVVAIDVLTIPFDGRSDEPLPPPTHVSSPQRYVDLAKFLQMPSVRAELKLTDAQLKELVSIEEETKKRVTEIFENVDRSSQEDKRRATLEIEKELEMSRELCARVFTPEQRSRAQQLAFQFISRKATTGYGLLTASMIKELGISDEQAATIRKKSDAIAKQIKSKDDERKTEIEALRVKLQSELIESLAPNQRARAKELFGELISLD